jgi:hypothetical protein
MNTHTKDLVNFLLNNIKQTIKSPDAKKALIANPSIQKELQLENELQIATYLNLLKARHQELSSYVRLLKDHISDVTDKSLLAAVYLLLSYNLHIWESLFILAPKGQYSAILTLIRMLKEISMLAQHFVLEERQGKRIDLDRWFSGEFVNHSAGRESFSIFAKEDGAYPDLDVKKLQAHLYQAESLTPHSAYVSVLDTVSPFTEDVDFEGYKGFSRTTSALRYANGTMTDLNLALKMVYGIVLRDSDGYMNLDEILLRYDPSMKQKTLDKDVLDSFKKDRAY